MTIDLACLVANALWGLLLVFVEVGAKTRIAGTAWNAGNRQTSPTFPAWIDRTGRALSNHKENFPIFLTAVLVAHVTGHADRITAAASVTYVVARALHAVVYIAGVEKVRSLLYLVGLCATLAIFARLI